MKLIAFDEAEQSYATAVKESSERTVRVALCEACSVKARKHDKEVWRRIKVIVSERVGFMKGKHQPFGNSKHAIKPSARLSKDPDLISIDEATELLLKASPRSRSGRDLNDNIHTPVQFGSDKHATERRDVFG